MPNDDFASCRWPNSTATKLSRALLAKRRNRSRVPRWTGTTPQTTAAPYRALTELVALLRNPLNDMEGNMLAEPLLTIEDWAPRLGVRTRGQLLRWLPEHGLLGVFLERLNIVRRKPRPGRGDVRQHLSSRIGHEWDREA